ncbi:MULTISPECIES: Arm DNA-binding domain-containing protein [Nostoc]|uniref:DUF3596 domain-containing protein n=1 Tax=Nostoc paludosum FACHB-159 TaxID=2692908 RepID=A0ABR8KIJ8_9NOSO|nr:MULTISPECIES: DUF3596 domain-containing protein [Nostoc]MBD2681725.1 DUF3596 domain-containing protein [Nostoc sp. FACHB-857]MBD2738120.1 DUF3596 domain-containing protein [Nostoc paludosum FACHB-159]
MYSKPNSSKASKGTVQVISSNDRLQLRFRFAGKRHYLSIGLADNSVNRKAAEAKARQIELDIVSGNFDPTLAKYKPQAALSTVATEITRSITAKTSLAYLWEQFVEYKRPQCSPNTMRLSYGVFSNYVRNLPTHDLDKANEIRDYILNTIPLYSGKRFITRLSACCEWAIESGMISENPFQGMATKINLPKSSTTKEIDEINPFSLQERDKIINAIENNLFCPRTSAFKHSHYAPFVRFLFLTGCRPSEAIALQWKHISQDFRQINFEQAIIKTESGKQVRQGLKTQERRKFPCNDSLRQLLQSNKPQEATSDSFVFPSPKGKVIDIDNFRGRIWTTVIHGLEIEYRKLYQTRHTFITHALETGKLDAKDVARLVGNSPEIIYQHYAGNKRELFVPEF